MKSNPTRMLAGLAAGTTLLTAMALQGVAATNPSTPTAKGPSTAEMPYLLPLVDTISTTSILTVGEKAANGYQMVGIPDGMGAYDNGDGTITVLMNHEFGATSGAVHAHGEKGSFVSEWIIDKATLEVKSGDDLIKNAVYADPSLPKAFARFCSADLPTKEAFFNAATGNGYDGRIFMNGEEDPASGRALAHVATGAEKGTSYEVEAMGNASWENIVANPTTGDKTVMIGMDDSTPGEVYVYVGSKKSTGTAIEKSGLTGGKLFGISAMGGQDEFDTATKAGNAAFPTSGQFTLVDMGDQTGKNTADLQALSDAGKVTKFWRPEDGAWDVTNPNVFYFNTTAKAGATSRTWKLTFADVNNPELGGSIEAVLDGTENTVMLDNMAASADGKTLILNEDPGNNTYLSKVYSYELATDVLTPILQHDPKRFDPALKDPSFLTQDEESSATIDTSDTFGAGTYLVTTQAHYTNADPNLVEGGQLQLITPRATTTPTTSATPTNSATPTTSPSPTGPVITRGTVSISGTPTVGLGLTANTSGFAPSNVSYAYQWSCMGKPIPGAVGKTFTPTQDQLGCRMSVRVTAMLPGATSIVQGSSETKPVVSIDTQAPSTGIMISYMPGQAVVTLNARDLPLGAAQSGVARTFWRVDGKGNVLNTTTGKVTVLLGKGTHYITFWSTDRKNNVEAKRTVTPIVVK